MTTTFDTIVLFFMANPFGLMLLVSLLVLAEYKLAKHIYQSDPSLEKLIEASSRHLKKIHLLHARKFKIHPIYSNPSQLHPIPMYIKIHKVRHLKRGH